MVPKGKGKELIRRRCEYEIFSVMGSIRKLVFSN
jgi:hypothetical protein